MSCYKDTNYFCNYKLSFVAKCQSDYYLLAIRQPLGTLATKTKDLVTLFCNLFGLDT